jgi:hypothetical protein
MSVWYESLSFKMEVLEVLLGFSRCHGHQGALLDWPTRRVLEGEYLSSFFANQVRYCTKNIFPGR